MTRKPLVHGGVFDDETFARTYARKHEKMAARFGVEYGRRLREHHFHRGRILDVGCGFGGTNLALARTFPDSELVGVDLSDPLLALARTSAAEEGVSDRVRFEKADVQELPFETDSFDVLLNLNMAHLVDDPVRMFDEMERVLRPKGFLFMADLRRSFLGLMEREIKSAFSSQEAGGLIRDSSLRRGSFSSGILWWRYEVLP